MKGSNFSRRRLPGLIGAKGRTGNRFALVALLMTAAISFAGAQEGLTVPSDKYVSCIECHGAQLMGNPVIKAPRLSGMEAWYVENQLNAFKKGWRGKHESATSEIEMQPMAAALSAAEIRDIAAFVAATKSEPPPVTIEGDTDRGKTLYSSCAACHGANGEGNIALGSPALTGHNDWYLVTQLEHFRAGIRGGKPGDIYGMQMRSSSGLLPDEQAIRDVVTYISNLQYQ
jgi:cytochrome c oxidase subunit 2